jgi:hypothetical protein
MVHTPQGALDHKILRPIVAAGATKLLTYNDDGSVVKLDTLAGSIVTLPKAVGSGVSFLFIVSVLATSNSHIVKVGNTTDVMQGIILMNGDTAANAAEAFAAAATDDTITLNRTTTGSVTLGEHIEVMDVAPGVWQVRGAVSATGVEATPFSATV